MYTAEFPYDTVIVLSQSDWFTEMRSNRYHFTTRFSQLVPTYFVQRFNKDEKELIAGTEGNLTVVNPVDGYTYDSIYRIVDLARMSGAKKILFWIYCPLFNEVLKRIALPFSSIYHATEAYLDSDMLDPALVLGMDFFLDKVKKTINGCAFVVSVSDGITESYRKNKEISVPVYSVTNGCDFAFWNGFSVERSQRENAVLYQGGIHKKIDFALLVYLAKNNTSVAFWLCGECYVDDSDLLLWQELIALPNVKFFGKLPVEKVRNLSHKARIGIMPFKINDWLIRKAFPLKAFEYLSAGLDVLSTPIDALIPYGDLFVLCKSYGEFDAKLKERIVVNDIDARWRIGKCREQDYSVKFQSVLELIAAHRPFHENRFLQHFKKKVLMLYDVNSCHVNTIREHVNSFSFFSRHEITYYQATAGNNIDEDFLANFDVVAVHYSVRVSVPGHLSVDIFNKLQQYRGYKVLFIQDEYDNLPGTYGYMQKIAFNAVFTCVPDRYVEYVYPKKMFPGTIFINNLTGYVPYGLLDYQRPPIANRTTDVFYRGRQLPYFYGTLGMEKYEIGVKFKEKVLNNDLGLNIDVESDDYKRIYGDAWYHTLAGSKATLATESGSNLFDFNGDLKSLMDADIKAGNDYDFIYSKYIKDNEKDIRMNQISPKLFEAICLGTVLILYEGEYSGVLTPYEHYIPLKKDFSNFDEVIGYLRDDQRLQTIADKAYADIVKDEKYSYREFINGLFDKKVDENCMMTRGEEYIVHEYPVFKDYLKDYFFRRSELEKAVLGMASPVLRSEDYEKVYKQKNIFGKNIFNAFVYRTVSQLPTNWINAIGNVIRVSMRTARSLKKNK